MEWIITTIRIQFHKVLLEGKWKASFFCYYHFHFFLHKMFKKRRNERGFKALFCCEDVKEVESFVFFFFNFDFSSRDLSSFDTLYTNSRHLSYH